MAVEKEKGLKCYNYGEPYPDANHMTVVLEIDGELAGRYYGRYDGNMVRCLITRRFMDIAPRRMDVAPEYMVNRRGQMLPKEHQG
jgi:hypothetical protein